MAIPIDLKQVFQNRELKRSLKTTDMKAARILASAYEREAQTLFALERAKRVYLMSHPPTELPATTPRVDQRSLPPRSVSAIVLTGLARSI
jgi:phosphohistidine phosphatase SixA